MTNKEKIERIGALTCSLAINFAVLVDKMHGESDISEESFIKAIKRDVEESTAILGVDESPDLAREKTGKSHCQ